MSLPIFRLKSISSRPVDLVRSTEASAFRVSSSVCACPVSPARAKYSALASSEGWPTQNAFPGARLRAMAWSTYSLGVIFNPSCQLIALASRDFSSASDAWNSPVILPPFIT